MSQIAKNLIEARKLKGISQEELAQQTQVNIRTIQRIENGENVPRGSTLALISDALNLDIAELINESENSKSKRIVKLITNTFFLICFNAILMAVIGFLTLDSNANLNSRFAGFLLSFAFPLIIVSFTKEMDDHLRVLYFGSGYIIYFVLALIMVGFPVGFTTGLFPCLLLSVGVLYYGKILYKL